MKYLVLLLIAFSLFSCTSTKIELPPEEKEEVTVAIPEEKIADDLLNQDKELLQVTQEETPKTETASEEIASSESTEQITETTVSEETPSNNTPETEKQSPEFVAELKPENTPQPAEALATKKEESTPAPEAAPKTQTKSTTEVQPKSTSNTTTKDVTESPNKANTEPSSQTTTEAVAPQTETVPEKEVIVPSRKVTIKKNQYLDVNYPGTGWIYLGEDGKTAKLIFLGRKILDSNTRFTLRSKLPGTSVLHFYKNDILLGKYIDDYLEVTIEDEVSVTSEHAVCPSYAEVVPQKPQPKSSEIAPKEVKENSVTTTDTKPIEPVVAENSEPSNTNIQTVIQSSTPKEDTVESAKVSNESKATTTKPAKKGDLLESARQEYNNKNYVEALSDVQQFFENAMDRIDEGLYLEGQILEAKSEIQNIKSAITAYESLMKNYPSSSLWNDAKQRSTYLRRFYIDIR